MSSDSFLLFVYGTLRRGLENHHLMIEAEFLGSAHTRDLYALRVGEFPHVCKSEPVSPIVG